MYMRARVVEMATALELLLTDIDAGPRPIPPLFVFLVFDGPLKGSFARH